MSSSSTILLASTIALSPSAPAFAQPKADAGSGTISGAITTNDAGSGPTRGAKPKTGVTPTIRQQAVARKMAPRPLPAQNRPRRAAGDAGNVCQEAITSARRPSHSVRICRSFRSNGQFAPGSRCGPKVVRIELIGPMRGAHVGVARKECRGPKVVAGALVRVPWTGVGAPVVKQVEVRIVGEPAQG